MGVVIQLKKHVDYVEVAKMPVTVPKLAEVPQQEKPHKGSWLWQFILLVSLAGYGGGFWLAAYYGNRIYVNAVADGVHSSTAHVVSGIPGFAVFGIFVAATICLVYWAWVAPYKWARWIRGE